ncbi:hypothetical protein PG996_009042 [Apiospora saccharicola]|uniref:Uncharacterized protein n=1 Tax=Apiospora saccharicola TaxID=335842 RepID=A0ABR1UJM4_9PEZI
MVGVRRNATCELARLDLIDSLEFSKMQPRAAAHGDLNRFLLFVNLHRALLPGDLAPVVVEIWKPEPELIAPDTDCRHVRHTKE